MKRKLSMILALALALALLTAGALAATGVIFKGRVDVAKLADAALEDAYGIKLPMQTYFQRAVIEEGKDKATVLYKPVESDAFGYVLGEYTVTVEGGKATAAWSWDGTPVAEGFDAAPWGAKQLQEMTEDNRVSFDYSKYYSQAIALADAAGVTQPAFHIPTEEEMLEITKAREATLAIVESQRKLSPDALSAIGHLAIMETYGITDDMLPYLTRVAENDTWGVDNDDRGLWALAFAFGNSEAGDYVGDTHPEWMEWIGNYVVTISVETGVVEDMFYDSTLAGNG